MPEVVAIPVTPDAVMFGSPTPEPTFRQRELWRLYLCTVVSSRQGAHKAWKVAEELRKLDPNQMPADEVTNWKADYEKFDSLMVQVAAIVTAFDAPTKKMEATNVD